MKNKNYICLNGQKIEIEENKLSEIKKTLGVKDRFYIDKNEKGEQIAHVGEYDFLVLERSGDTIALLLKSLYKEKVIFGSNNDYRGSNVQKICREFAREIASIVGEENVVEHTVDLTSNDGLRDYGKIREKSSLLSADLYRRYVDILDLDRLDKYWWLATPWSTPRHNESEWINCVSPRGRIDDVTFNDGGAWCGVRPFLILKSDIFGS
ncbi:MAG: hypothetical protein J6S14_12825 [Clostridia bacterium]|nr:hypothetical protein [Clostridia bacterium]